MEKITDLLYSYALWIGIKCIKNNWKIGKFETIYIKCIYKVIDIIKFLFLK